MQYMEFENGVEDGRRAVEINAEFDWKLSDYKKNLKHELLEYKDGATAAEKREHSAGYMRGVRDALDEEEAKTTTAEKWLGKIDAPWRNEPDEYKRVGTSIDRRAVKLMMEGAEDVLQGASGRCTDIYVFADGSGLYLKRRDDWFPMTADDVTHCKAGELY
jgi:hypothetical protein